MSADDEKRAAGAAAADLVEPGMIVGLGTGSTAVWFVRALAARRLPIRAVATSTATAALAGELGLEMVAIDSLTGPIDLTVDGADEIGPGLDVIKGAGGALLREKLVWRASRRCVVIADASKSVKTLGKFPLSIEVVAFAHATTAERISSAMGDCGLTARLDLRMNGAAPLVTDGGNLIYDADCRAIEKPAALAAALKAVTGVVEHGLFLGLAERALIGTPAGVETLWP